MFFLCDYEKYECSFYLIDFLRALEKTQHADLGHLVFKLIDHCLHFIGDGSYVVRIVLPDYRPNASNGFRIVYIIGKRSLNTFTGVGINTIFIDKLFEEIRQLFDKNKGTFNISIESRDSFDNINQLFAEMDLEGNEYNDDLYLIKKVTKSEMEECLKYFNKC
jgi:hypothetical protein